MSRQRWRAPHERLPEGCLYNGLSCASPPPFPAVTRTSRASAVQSRRLSWSLSKKTTLNEDGVHDPNRQEGLQPLPSLGKPPDVVALRKPAQPLWKQQPFLFARLQHGGQVQESQGTIRRPHGHRHVYILSLLHEECLQVQRLFLQETHREGQGSEIATRSATAARAAKLVPGGMKREFFLLER